MIETLHVLASAIIVIFGCLLIGAWVKDVYGRYRSRRRLQEKYGWPK